MIKKFGNVGANRSSLISDFFSLILLQGLNYSLAFFVTPYIVRRLGPENFGLVSFSQSYITYFTLIINFGFDFTATRDIAKNIGNAKELNKIFSEVLISKLLLFALSFVIFFITLFRSDELRGDALLHITSFIINIGFVLYPQWLFQGLSKMKAALTITIIVRLLMLVCIIGFVKTREDYGIYNFINSISNVLLGIISMTYLLSSNTVKVRFVPINVLIRKLKSSFTVFLSLAIYSLYTSSNIVLLGFLSSKTSTGFFTCAAKVITISLGIIFIPFSTVVFPKVSQRFSASFSEGKLFLKKITWLSFIMGLFMSATVFFFADDLIFLLYGKEFASAVNSLRYLSGLPLITMLSNVFAVQGLLNLKMDKQFLGIMITTGGSSILLNILLIPKMNEVGACISWNVAELIYLIMSSTYLSKRVGILFDLGVAKSSLNLKTMLYGK